MRKTHEAGDLRAGAQKTIDRSHPQIPKEQLRQADAGDESHAPAADGVPFA